MTFAKLTKSENNFQNIIFININEKPGLIQLRV